MTLWWGYLTWKPAGIYDSESPFQCFILISNWLGRVLPGVAQMLLKVTQALNLTVSSVSDDNHAVEGPKI